jgi:hypothetical protein
VVKGARQPPSRNFRMFLQLEKNAAADAGVQQLRLLMLAPLLQSAQLHVQSTCYNLTAGTLTSLFCASGNLCCRLIKPYAWLTMGIMAANVIGSPVALGLLSMDGIGGLK